MKIERFEDLECWQQARLLVNMVYSAINNSSSFQRDYRLVDQITGAAVSVMNNIVEGWASQSNAEFIRFLTYSRRSGAETQNCAYVAIDQGYIIEDTFNAVYDQALRTIKIIDGLLRYLRSRRQKKKAPTKLP
jgi:four helix bundle protein